jgi:ankyrin repeat protein
MASSFADRFASLIESRRGAEAVALVNSQRNATDFSSLQEALVAKIIELLKNVYSKQGRLPTRRATRYQSYIEQYREPSNGDTLLHYAVRSNNVGLVEFLILSTPSLLRARNKKGFTPIHVVAKHAHTSDDSKVILNIVLTSASTDDLLIVDILRRSPLIVTLKSGTVETCRLFIQRYHQFPELIYTPSFNNPMHYAAQNKQNSLEVLRLLVDYTSPDKDHPNSRFGQLDEENREGITPVDVLRSTNIHKEEDVYDLLAYQTQTQLFSSPSDEKKRIEYTQAAASGDYLTTYTLISDKDSGVATTVNIFDQLADDPEASPELVPFFAKLTVGAFMLHRFVPSTANKNSAVVEAINKARHGDLPQRLIVKKLSDVFDEHELADIKVLDIDTLSDLIDFLASPLSFEFLPEDAPIRRKGEEYVSTMSISASPLKLTDVYDEHEIADIKALGIDNSTELMDYFSAPESYNVIPAGAPLRVKSKEFTKSPFEQVSSVFLNLDEVYNQREVAYLRENGINDAESLLRFLIDDSSFTTITQHSPIRTKSSRLRRQIQIPVDVEHSATDSTESLVQSIKSQEALMFINKKRELATRNQKTAEFIQVKRIQYENFVKDNNFSAAYSMLRRYPMFIHEAVGEFRSNIFHQLARAAPPDTPDAQIIEAHFKKLGKAARTQIPNASSLYEFFRLPGALQALEQHNGFGETPIDTVQHTHSTLANAFEAFAHRKLSFSEYSQIYDKGYSAGEVSILGTQIRAFIANLPSPREQQLIVNTNTDRFEIYFRQHLTDSKKESNTSTNVASGPVFLAAEQNNYREYEQLIKKYGKDTVFNLTDDNGWNAAHYAAANNALDIVNYLDRVGFTGFKKQTKSGETPADLARRNSYNVLASRLDTFAQK